MRANTICGHRPDWRDEDILRLEKVAEVSDCRICIKNIDDATFRKLPVLRKHLTRAAFYRLLIPGLLPDSARAIYMDCDMVVTGPLHGAWTADISDCLVAAVPCPSPTQAALEQLNLQKGDYVNSGFLVINLDAWRREGIAEACLGRLSVTPPLYLTEDESAINDICRGRIRKLSGIYNTYASEGIDQPAFRHPEQIRVLHFIIKMKPWRRPSLFSPIWEYEVAPIRDLLPTLRDAREEGFAGKVRRFNRWRKAFFMFMSIRPDKRRAHALRRKILREWIPTYLRTGSFVSLAEQPVPETSIETRPDKK